MYADVSIVRTSTAPIVIEKLSLLMVSIATSITMDSPVNIRVTLSNLSILRTLTIPAVLGIISMRVKMYNGMRAGIS